MISSMLETGEGFFAPVVFTVFALLAFAVVLLLSSFGRKGFSYSRAKASCFFSGNMPSAGTRVRASDFYWGFLKAMEPYYGLLLKIHTGIVNDYVMWFIVVVSLLLAVLSAGVFFWA